ncbi:DEAD-box ATP-dependent RNA helicase 36 [Primulina tabacum]|uniref:DEAD-box ATP-dependent RNA helicase 36 n=1 Tax=Primulina tabacum TaxID=48773 RepID=UPI003F597CB6
MEGDIEVDKNFPLFHRRKSGGAAKISRPPKPSSPVTAATIEAPKSFEKELNPDPTPAHVTFSDLGLAEWAVKTCKELGMKRPTPVQQHCVPKILSGQDVMGLAQTGSGKTAAFALPILHRLAEDPYGVFALVVTPTRELAYQLAEQFRAFGSGLGLRVAVVVGGMDMINQAQALIQRPHVVIATPGRIKVLIEQNPDDIPAVFSKAKFLVLDEADRVLGVNFEAELRVIFQCLPKNRQTLLFSATMTSNLQTLLELSANKAYFYAAYEGLKTVESLRQQYIFIPKNVKDVYLLHVLKKMEEMSVRSAIIFVSTCRSCELLSLLLEQLEFEVAALHSFKSQSSRLSALHKFKSGRVPLLIATDIANRGLDIPTVDLVLNYDVPRYPEDYVHRVGRTARAGRGGLALSFITQNDVDLVQEIEAVIGKQLEKFGCEEKEVLEDNITKVYKARRVATMRMMDDGFDEKAKERKAQKLKSLAEKGLLKKKKKSKKRRREKPSQDLANIRMD